MWYDNETTVDYMSFMPDAQACVDFNSLTFAFFGELEMKTPN